MFTPKSQLSSVRCSLSDTEVAGSWSFSMSCPCLRDAELVLEEPGREQGRSLSSGYQSHLALLARVSRRDSSRCLGVMSISIAAAVGLAGVSVAAAVLRWFFLPSWCSSSSPPLHPAEPCHCRQLCQEVAQLQPQLCQGCLSSQGPCWGSHSIDRKSVV